MGYVKEPAGIDLIVAPMTLTEKDRQEISDIIAQYKRTGKVPEFVRKPKTTPKSNAAHPRKPGAKSRSSELGAARKKRLAKVV